MERTKHGIAAYPYNFRGYLVSATKICLQYNDPQLKTRADEDMAGLIKLPSTERALPISTLGTEVSFIAVGHQMPTLEDMQLELVKAYKEYYNKHRDTYKEKYGKEFKDFLLELKTDIDNLIKEIL